MTKLSKYSKLMIFIILLITFWAHWPSTANDFIALDDPGYLVQNPNIRELSYDSIKKIFTTPYNVNYHYQPLLMLSYAIEYHFFELNPKIYHLTNLIFHLINTVLVYWFVLMLTGNRLGALIVRVFFAIHPMNVESSDSAQKNDIRSHKIT